MSPGSNDPLAAFAATPANKPTRDHHFNDDLLANAGDLAYARSQFPQIIHVLDHPQLREKFAQYEERANRSRDRVRSLGLVAVISATLALLVVATKPIWPHGSWTRWTAAVVESGGILAALMAAGGMWLGPWKCRWLESRLMTERLRQWHFQLLVRCGPQIEASCSGSGAVAEFKIERTRWFEDFLRAHEGHLDSQLESLISEPGPIGSWLHDPPKNYRPNGQVLTQVFDAYRRLRFDHQYAYTVYKLRKTPDEPFWRFLKWPASGQMRILSGLASACFVSAFIFAVLLVYGHASENMSTSVEMFVRTGAIAIALVGAGLRTIQGGLAPDKELDRYGDYRTRTSRLRDRFEQAEDTRERLELMEEMELVSVDELKGFLRTHQRASFMLA